MMRKEKSRGIFCGFYIKWFVTGFEYPWHSYMTYIRPVSRLPLSSSFELVMYKLPIKHSFMQL